MKRDLLDHGFKAHVINEYERLGFDPTNSYLKKILFISPTLVGAILEDAFIEISLVVLFLLIVTGMSQGRDMVVSFFEPESLFGFGRIVFTTLTIINYSICMWLIPAFLFELRDKKNNITSKEEILKNSFFSTHLFFAHRTISLLPFWIFCYSIQHSTSMHILIIACAAFQLILLNIIYSRCRSFLKSLKIITLLSTTLLFFLCWFFFQKQYALVKGLYTALLFVISFGLYLYFARDKRVN